MSIDKTRCKEFVFTECNNFTFISVQNISCTSLLKVFHAIFNYNISGRVNAKILIIGALSLDMKTFAKTFLCNNGPIFDNQCCIFYHQRNPETTFRVCIPEHTYCGAYDFTSPYDHNKFINSYYRWGRRSKIAC